MKKPIRYVVMQWAGYDGIATYVTSSLDLTSDIWEAKFFEDRDVAGRTANVFNEQYGQEVDSLFFVSGVKLQRLPYPV